MTFTSMENPLDRKIEISLREIFHAMVVSDQTQDAHQWYSDAWSWTDGWNQEDIDHYIAERAQEKSYPGIMDKYRKALENELNSQLASEQRVNKWLNSLTPEELKNLGSS